MVFIYIIHWFVLNGFLVSKFCAFGANLECQLTTNIGNLSHSIADLEDKLIINCSSIIDGNNSKLVEWRKDNEPILNATSFILSKNNVTREDAGRYECTLIGENQRIETCSLLVKVNVPPLVKLMPNCEELRHTMLLSCFINGYPKPEVSWYKNGEKLSLSRTFNKSNYFVENDNRTGQNYHSLLQKYHPGEDTFAKYTCEAENRYGKMNVTRSVHCKRETRCPNFLEEQTTSTVYMYTGETKTLLCHVKFYNDRYHLDYYGFSRVNQSHDVKNGHSSSEELKKTIILNYTIVNATEDNTGKYVCFYRFIGNNKCDQLLKYFDIIIRDRQVPGTIKRERNIYVAIAVSVAGAVVGLVVVLLVCYLRKRRLKLQYLYESLPELRWDVFVSYSSEDYQWVKELCEVLEEPPFNLIVCLHHRDWELGRAIIDNMIDSVYCSRKTLVIMSKSYLKSAYCMQELQIAMHSELGPGENNKERIVLIKIDDVSLHKLPRALRQKSYLDFSDNEQYKHFKTKLLRALPKRELMDGTSGGNEVSIDSSDNVRLEEISLV